MPQERINLFGYGMGISQYSFLLILKLWARYLSIFIFVNTLGVCWVSLNVSSLFILLLWAGSLSIFVFFNTLGVGWVSLNISSLLILLL